MRNAAALGGRQFGGSDIEMPIDLQRIAIDHFAVESNSYFECESAFSRPGWSRDRNQRRLGCVTAYRVDLAGLMRMGYHGTGFCVGR